MNNLEGEAVTSDPEYTPSTFALAEGIKLLWKLSRVHPPDWPADMDTKFKSAGLEDVIFRVPPIRRSAVQTMTQSNLMVLVESCETVVQRFPERQDEADELSKLADKAWWEFQEKGVGYDPKARRCIGRKSAKP